MANRKYLFFADGAKTLGNADLAKLFRDTANQETEHAFAHFRLLHPELVVEDPCGLSDEQKQLILSRCLQLAIEGETYERVHHDVSGICSRCPQGSGSLSHG